MEVSLIQDKGHLQNLLVHVVSEDMFKIISGSFRNPKTLPNLQLTEHENKQSHAHNPNIGIRAFSDAVNSMQNYIVYSIWVGYLMADEKLYL